MEPGYLWAKKFESTWIKDQSSFYIKSSENLIVFNIFHKVNYSLVLFFYCEVKKTLHKYFISYKNCAVSSKIDLFC